MENNTGRRHVRDWIDPTRLYDPRVPAGRLIFLWGLAIYPLLVIFLLMTVVIIVVEAVATSANIADYLGIVTWIFMLGWVGATVAICRRRFLQLGMSQGWVWVAILPVVNLILFLYMLLKSGPVESYPVA